MAFRDVKSPFFLNLFQIGIYLVDEEEDEEEIEKEDEELSAIEVLTAQRDDEETDSDNMVASSEDSDQPHCFPDKFSSNF